MARQLRHKQKAPKAPAEPPATRNGKPEEFSNFESLTRKLVRVPKREIDEKRNGS